MCAVRRWVALAVVVGWFLGVASVSALPAALFEYRVVPAGMLFGQAAAYRNWEVVGYGPATGNGTAGAFVTLRKLRGVP